MYKIGPDISRNKKDTDAETLNEGRHTHHIHQTKNAKKKFKF
jgi:hypothetical protein